MHTPLLVGIFAFFALASVCVAAFFVRAWSARREDREYLVFGVVNASLAAHALVAGLAYGQAAGMVSGWRVELVFMLVVLPSKAALATVFHFSLLHARVRRAGAIALPVYVLMGAFVLLGLSGRWWAHVGTPFEAEVFGLTLHRTVLVPSSAARPFYLIAPALVTGCIFLFARNYRQTRRGLGALIGSMVLGLSVLNDLALGAGWFPTIPAFAIGSLGFTYGVALTLVSRYARTASELQASTDSLRRQSRELERSYGELRRTQLELVRSEQLAVIGELAAVIAHEVRNPLAIVSNAVASLRKRRTTGRDRRTLLEIINEEMGRLDTLVGRLIHYARPVVLDRQPIALEEIVARSAAVVEGAGLTVELEARVPMPEVPGDPALLRQLFENILANAKQAVEKGGVIRARFSRRNVGGVPVVAVEVIDEGEGMTAEEVESALTPFFTTRPTGTGLGLPIVARIVEAHGGQVQIDSEKGKGTTITVLLPVTWGTHLKSLHDGKRISLLP